MKPTRKFSICPTQPAGTVWLRLAKKSVLRYNDLEYWMLSVSLAVPGRAPSAMQDTTVSAPSVPKSKTEGMFHGVVSRSRPIPMLKSVIFYYPRMISRNGY